MGAPAVHRTSRACASLGLPAIGCGVLGWQPGRAARVALATTLRAGDSGATPPLYVYYMYIAYTARLRKQQQQQKPNVFAKAVAPPGSGFRRSQHLENTTTGHLTYTSLRGNLSGDQRHTLRQFIAAADASRARWHANRQQTRQLILKGAEMSWGIGTTRSIALKPKSRSRLPHYKKVALQREEGRRGGGMQRRKLPPFQCAK